MHGVSGSVQAVLHQADKLAHDMQSRPCTVEWLLGGTETYIIISNDRSVQLCAQ
jgi:hypothetical protein